MEIIQEVIKNKSMLLNLAKTDFKNRFAGSYLGIIWAFVQPLVTIIVYSIVFGFGVSSNSEVPFFFRLVTGICPWFFFNEAINSSSNSLVEYSYIVKKVMFKIELIPMIKLLSAFFVHVFFVILVFTISLFFKYWPTIYTLQAIYYTLCVFILSMGIAYFISAINVFFKDMSQIVNVILQFMMWFLPIMYDIEGLDGKFTNLPTVVTLLKLNPMYYVIEGYKDAFIYQVGFWEKPLMTLYFWLFTFIIFLISSSVFKKLKPHFADVL